MRGAHGSKIKIGRGATAKLREWQETREGKASLRKKVAAIEKSFHSSFNLNAVPRHTEEDGFYWDLVVT